MASSTPNLGLTLPVGGEHVSRQIINANNVKIDEAVGPVPSGTDLQSQVTALNNKISNITYTTYTNFFESNGNGFSSGVVLANAADTPFSSGSTDAIQFKYSDSYGVQFSMRPAENKIFFRRIASGTWTSWYDIAQDKINLNNSSNITWEITDSDSYYVKTGYVYDLAFDKLSAQNYTNGMLIGTVLNTNQLPDRSLYFPVIDEDTAKPINGSVFFSNSTGKLTYYGDALTNKKIRFHGTWIGKQIN